MWFQPLTNFSGKKCKRCGFYEEDKILYDDVFDEWELCPSDFTAPDGRYIHFKENEFNASFLCSDCLNITGGEFPATFFSWKTPYSYHGIRLHRQLCDGSWELYDANATIMKL